MAIPSRAPKTNTNMTEQALLDVGFTHLDPTECRRIVASTASHEKTGKTHFALTWPKPIGIIAIDPGTEEIVRKHIRKGWVKQEDVYVCSVDVPENPSRDEQATYQATWDKMKEAFLTVVRNPIIKTLVVDTCTEMWEQLRLARHGKLTQIMPHQYGPLNNEMRQLLKKDLYSRRDLNALLIHKVKKEYREGKKGDSQWTGRYEFSGFSDVPYIVDANLENYYDRESRLFGVRVLVPEGRSGFRINPACNGLELEGEQCSFDWLAAAAWPPEQ